MRAEATNFTGTPTGGFGKWNDQSQYKGDVKGIPCAKCGKPIPPGQEVKKGFLRKKYYHRQCVG